MNRLLYLNTQGNFAEAPHALADLSQSTGVCLAVVPVALRRGKSFCRNGFFSFVSVISEIYEVVKYMNGACSPYRLPRAVGGRWWRGEPLDFSLSHCDKPKSPSAAAVSCASVNFEVTGTARLGTRPTSGRGRQQKLFETGGAR
jgi:hypothetical protein